MTTLEAQEEGQIAGDITLSLLDEDGNVVRRKRSRDETETIDQLVERSTKLQRRGVLTSIAHATAEIKAMEKVCVSIKRMLRQRWLVPSRRGRYRSTLTSYRGARCKTNWMRSR